jgi:putative hemolysin
LRLTENNSRFLATIQVGVTLTSFFASAFGAVSLVKLFESWFKGIPVDFIRENTSTLAFIAVTVLVAFVSLIFGELIPKTLALESAERVSLVVARPIEIIATVARPLVFALTVITNFFVRLLGGKRRATMPSVSEEEIVSMVETGQEEGVLGKQESDIISRVFEFTDRQVREIMVPRMDVTMLEAAATVEAAAREVIATGYSRYPVYATGNREQIVGVAFAKDVLHHMVDGQSHSPITILMRKPYFIPESKRVGDLLAELQHSRIQIALIIDEYGGFAGLVTLEDCLEEIVGEIQDEFDSEVSKIEPIEGGGYFIDGATTLNEVNLTLELQFADDEVDTIGGFVLKRLGRIAVIGDKVTVTETRQMPNPADPDSDEFVTIETRLTLTVEKIEGLRIRQVKMIMEQSPVE